MRDRVWDQEQKIGSNKWQSDIFLLIYDLFTLFVLFKGKICNVWYSLIQFLIDLFNSFDLVLPCNSITLCLLWFRMFEQYFEYCYGLENPIMIFPKVGSIWTLNCIVHGQDACWNPSKPWNIQVLFGWVNWMECNFRYKQSNANIVIYLPI